MFPYLVKGNSVRSVSKTIPQKFILQRCMNKRTRKQDKRGLISNVVPLPDFKWIFCNVLCRNSACFTMPFIYLMHKISKHKNIQSLSVSACITNCSYLTKRKWLSTCISLIASVRLCIHFEILGNSSGKSIVFKRSCEKFYSFTLGNSVKQIRTNCSGVPW